MSGTPDDDAALFRAAASGVRRLVATHQRPDSDKPPSTRLRPAVEDEHAVLAMLRNAPKPDPLEVGETLLYRANGVQDAVLRKLRRGQYRTEAELDLHGLTRDKAGLAVMQFLSLSQDHGARCVRIIHGKGNSSLNGTPVLKSYVASWLRQRNDVIAYCSARPADGGAGALYVLLRASKHTA
jgi:DNA-nicking Smr family endonuclease